MSNLEHLKALKEPRGKDRTVQDSTDTTISTADTVNSITPNTNKVLNIVGVNFPWRANILTVELILDVGLTNEQTIDFFAPPGPITDMYKPKTFDPPLKAYATCTLVVTDDGTAITGFVSVINAFETDE